MRRPSLSKGGSERGSSAIEFVLTLAAPALFVVTLTAVNASRYCTHALAPGGASDPATVQQSPDNDVVQTP